MKSRYAILIGALALLCLVQAAAALTYEGSITTVPTAVNALKPGDSISEVSGTVRLPSSGDQTFASKDNLEFYTQLDKGKWAISIRSSDGLEIATKEFGGKRAVISGWELAYPLDNYEGGIKVEFSLTDASIPATFPSGDIILVRARELDSSDNQVGTAVAKNGTVINPAALQSQVDSARSKLAELKSSIDGKNALGVDTTVAQQKYNTAKASIDSAAVKVTSSPADVTGLLSSASASMTDATDALDEAWASMTIEKAETMIGSVDGLLNEFRVNRSLKDTDVRLSPIIAQREFAAKSLSDAKNLFTQKSYVAVRTDAGQSLDYSTRAWNLSLELKKELDAGFQLPGLPNLSAFLPVILLIVVVAIIAGVIIYRRKMHWDELG